MSEKYKNWLLVNGNSVSTATNYIRRIEKVLKNISIEKLSTETISAYLLEMGKTKSPSTVNGYRDTIKSFLIFQKKDIEIPKHLKLIHKLPDSITSEYLEEKIIPIIECQYKNPDKLIAIIYFMFYTGIRVGEVEGISRGNINMEKCMAKVYIKKTKEERMVFFNDKTKKALTRYFSVEAEETNAFNTTTETVRFYFWTIKGYFDDINFRPHLLRHSFATMCLKKGIDVSIVSKLLGHRSIRSTMRYLNLNTELLQAEYRKRIK